MRNYLSFGGGVNSVAMMLLLLDEGVEFEAVYVDHGCDWPETREYVEMFQSKYPLKIIKPKVYSRKVNKHFDNLYEYGIAIGRYPDRKLRWCTSNWKVRPLYNYFQAPAFVMLGIDAGESHRAHISQNKGFESRWPLIERDIDREGCIEIIQSHGLPVPPKSGCWFCPFQKMSEYKLLRRKHPELFCKVVALEKRDNERRHEQGYGPRFVKGIPINDAITDKKAWLFDELAYPPCQCGL